MLLLIIMYVVCVCVCVLQEKNVYKYKPIDSTPKKKLS